LPAAAANDRGKGGDACCGGERDQRDGVEVGVNAGEKKDGCCDDVGTTTGGVGCAAEGIDNGICEQGRAEGCCAGKDQVGSCCSGDKRVVQPQSTDRIDRCATGKDNGDGHRFSEDKANACSKKDKTVCSTKEERKTCSGDAKDQDTCCATATTSEKTNVADSCGGDSCGGTEQYGTINGAGDAGGCVNKCCEIPLDDTTTAASPSACSEHLQAAFQRYEALLALGRCLCRSALSQLGVCCCSLTPDGLVKKPPTSRASSARGYNKRGTQAVSRKASRDPSVRSLRSDEISVVARSIQNPEAAVKDDIDVEKGAARQHIVTNVVGMTCTGCGKKVSNVLDRIPGLSNAQVTFVSGMAEFDLDENVAQAEDVLSQMERETGFKVTRLTSGYQTLDFLMSPTVAEAFEASFLPGLVSITKEKKSRYCITYNPRTTGARSLLPPDAQLAPPADDVGISQGKRRLWYMFWSFTIAAALTIPVVVLNWAPNPLSETTRQIVSLILATLVQAIAIPEFYVRALKSLIYSHLIEMDMLVVISTTTAYVYSIIAFALTEAGYELEQKAFFETSTLLITLILFGRLMTAWARMGAVSAVSLRSLQAESALLLQRNGETTKIDARLLQFGDEFKVLAHSRITTDGIVILGESTVDESMVTGESTPVVKSKGSTVISGTINGSGTLNVRLTRLPSENSIADIANLVDKAVGAKPRAQDLADRFASWFTPVALAVAVVVFVLWLVVELKVRHSNAGGAVGSAITYAVAVLAISCPCALGLAVPMVLVIAGGCAAREGVVIKAADATERGFKVTDVVFDKTGTLTKGDLQVVREEAFDGPVGVDGALAITRCLAEGNEHPVSLAVAAYLAERSLSTITLEKVKSIPGAGIKAQWNGSTVMAGNPYWLGLENSPSIAHLLSKGMTYFCVTINGELLLAFGLKSTLREEAATVIAELQRRKIQCHIVSGDNAKVVADVALTLGIPHSHTASRASPADKQQYIKHLQHQGKIALFCGDGTNDAVAVAQANVGVQIGSASEVTSAVADVVLLGGLEGVITLLDVSRRSYNRIRFNFVWSGVYNVFAVLLASGAFVKFRIPPGYAGLGEIVSVGPVIVAAASLSYRGKKRG